MGSIGTDLRQAREAAGLSREALSARTKIRPSLLEAMEQDDFAQLPAGLLGRGHLRAYAKEVHLDPDRLVQRFGNEWITEPPPAIEPPLDTGRPRVPADTLIVVAVLVAALALFVQSIGRAPAAGEDDAVGTTGVAANEAPPPAARAAAGPAAGPIAETAPSQPARGPETLALELSPTSPVWVEARADGQRVLYALVRQGERPVVQAKKDIQLRLGDAGAVNYSINGKRGRPFGQSGEVRDVRITRENLQTFQQ